MKFKRSSFIVKLVILIVVIYATMTLVTLQGQISAKKAENATLSQDITTVEQDNQRLRDDIATIDSDEGTERVARSKLGLAARGEIVFRDVGK